MRWLFKVGRKDTDRCRCEKGEVQNAVHIRRCMLVGDGKGRTLEEVERDQVFCMAVFSFLTDQLD